MRDSRPPTHYLGLPSLRTLRRRSRDTAPTVAALPRLRASEGAVAGRVQDLLEPVSPIIGPSTPPVWQPKWAIVRHRYRQMKWRYLNLGASDVWGGRILGRNPLGHRAGCLGVMFCQFFSLEWCDLAPEQPQPEVASEWVQKWLNWKPKMALDDSGCSKTRFRAVLGRFEALFGISNKQRGFQQSWTPLTYYMNQQNNSTDIGRPTQTRLFGLQHPVGVARQGNKGWITLGNVKSGMLHFCQLPEASCSPIIPSRSSSCLLRWLVRKNLP